jgi:hypothetical protein
MKTLSTFFVLLLAFTSTPGLKISDNEVSLAIDKHTTRDQLLKFKQKLWEIKKITFNIEQLTLTPNNEIETIRISVDCHDGFKGNAANNLQLSSSKIGFVRNYEPSSDIPFKIGAIE